VDHLWWTSRLSSSSTIDGAGCTGAIGTFTKPVKTSKPGQWYPLQGCKLKTPLLSPRQTSSLYAAPRLHVDWSIVGGTWQRDAHPGRQHATVHAEPTSRVTTAGFLSGLVALNSNSPFQVERVSVTLCPPEHLPPPSLRGPHFLLTKNKAGLIKWAHRSQNRSAHDVVFLGPSRW